MSQDDPSQAAEFDHLLNKALAAGFGRSTRIPDSSATDESTRVIHGKPRIRLRNSPVVDVSSQQAREVMGPPSRYLLFEEIGRGGMGTIVRAFDCDLGRGLAIKIVLQEHQNRSEILRRFVEEAQIAGQLQHPGIPPVYEIGEFDDGRPYFTMKLIEGRTLATLLNERSDLSQDLPRFLSIFEQMCQTLGYAHSRGVIHRDLKPANIMVGAFGEVQVMDWGMAKLVVESDLTGAVETNRVAADDGVHTRAGQVMGTPAYMAPEQARGETNALDERCDVFGLGAILCEILTGRPPFDGPASDEICDRAAPAI